MSYDAETLLNLLPALYRIRDDRLAQSKGLEQGPLAALLALIAEQLAVLEEDLDQLYDDQFIETCAPWVIPYIGDLIGYQAVKDAALVTTNSRSEVAHTISFRRRKGTVLVLEQLARDITGWGAHAVEFFQELSWTQYTNHVRLHNHRAPNLRRWQPREYQNTGFDTTAHLVDVRRIAVGRGRYNIPNIGIFLWSLKACRVTKSPSTQSGFSTQCFRFSPLGADLPLFNNPVSQGADLTTPAQPVNVAARLTRRVLCQDLTSGAGAYYGAGLSVAIYQDGALLAAEDIRVCDLSGEDGQWINLPVEGSPLPYLAAIDPELGRIALAPSLADGSMPPEITASFYYGFNADLGGGEYPRQDTFPAAPDPRVLKVPNDYPTIQPALDALNGDGVVEIINSNSYSEPQGLKVHVKAGGHIQLRAADGARPVLLLGDAISVTGDQSGAVDLNGLLLTYAPATSLPQLPPALVYVPSDGTNQLSSLGLIHCTLVPGWALTTSGQPRFPDEPALVAALEGLQVNSQKSILGGIRATPETTVNLTDTILDATALNGVAYAALDGSGAAGPLTFQACTIIGKVHATLLDLVSNTIFWAQLSEADAAGSPPGPWSAPLLAERKQAGCVRFSFLPIKAVVPRHFECVQQGPGLAQPLFVSLCYGQPGYAKMFASTPDVIRRGAEDGGEMGAFHFVLAPLREDNLRIRAQEYLPVGLEYGIIFET
jgi:hypothetical protein